MAGLLGDFGAVALRSRAPPPVSCPATGRQAAPAATIRQRRARTDSRAVLRSPGSLSPGKFTIKGAPGARRRYAAQTLDTELPRQDLGTDQEDGERLGACQQAGSGQMVQTKPVIGRWHGLVIDCPDPRGLAAFYQELLGMQRVQDDGHWVVIGDAPDRPGLAFQLAPDLEPPQWPDSDHPQQMHLDIAVTDIDQAEEQALGLGARRLPGQGPSFRVYSDPAGHPFCLVTPESSRSIG